jgi:nitrite reductase/ring-hydroxylating ferredoxin subunit
MNDQRFPFTDYPTGWYVVSRSDELQKKGVRGVHYFGQDIAVFRSEDGVAHATDAYCPHLGAYLPEGGCVEGDRLRCAFHGFEFDGGGRCVKVAYGTKAPPKARLRVWPVRELAGFIFVWYDGLGREPGWEIEAPDMTGWTSVRMQTVELRSHPQETTENSVDVGHFSELHGFRHAKVLEPCTMEGPSLRAAYSVELAGDSPIIDRVLGLLGRAGRGLFMRFSVHVQGLGWSMAQGEAPALGMRFRQFILATPIDQERMHLRIGAATERRVPGLDWVLREFGFRGLATEVARDRPIWEKKRYVERPILAKGDGPIAAYRKWCRQFYPPAQTASPQMHLPIAS